MKNFLRIGFIIIGLGLANQYTNAQCHTVGKGTTGGLYCMFNDSFHNRMFVGGGFQNSGTDTLHHCGYWNDTAFNRMGPGNYGTNDSVWCFTYFNGNLYVGGSFTQAGGISANHIARWDGAAWQAVGNGFNGEVYALAVFNNQLYAGGSFTASGATAINYLSAWNGTQWIQVGDGMNGNVRVLYPWKNALYIGGDFTQAGTLTVNHICNWNGSDFYALGSGFSNSMGPCYLQALCGYNGNLYCGGVFHNAGGHEMHNLAAWDGSSWISVGDVGGGMMNDHVSAFCVYNQRLFVSGNFSSCGPKSSNNIGVWNGTDWSTLGSGFNGTVNTMAVYHDKLYFGGTFTDATGTAVSNIASYSVVTGIQFSSPDKIFKLYPNPSAGKITLFLNDGNTNGAVNIYDIAGNKVYSEVFTAPDCTKDIELKINTGIYFIQLICGEEQATRKIIIE